MEKLPIEVLPIIFRNLPQSDLLRVTEVCRTFNSVVNQYHLITELHLGKNNDESWTPARKYVEAIVRNFKPNVHQRVFESLGHQLTSLKFNQCSMNLADIVKVLKFTPNVTHLRFDYVRLDDESLNATVELPQLRLLQVEFNEADPKIFQVLERCTAVKADLHFYGDTPYSMFNHFIDFLANQKDLTSLSVSGIYETLLFYPPIPKSTFQLKEFEIDNCDFEEWDGLEEFLNQHVNSLEKFTVKNMERWDASNILNQCKGLKSFENYQSVMEALEPLPTIEELFIEPVRGTMDQFPNVKKLSVTNPTTLDLQAISMNMTKLEDVTLVYRGVEGLEAPNIKKLRLQSLDSRIDPNFFVTHKNIEELTFLYVYDIDDSTLEALTRNLSKLRVLEIYGDNHFTARAYKIICDNCKNLKVLKTSGWDQRYTKSDWSCLYNLNGLRLFQEKF